MRNNEPKLRFLEFRGEWEQRRFEDDILSIQTGTNLLGSSINDGMALIKMGNIQRGYFSLDKLEYLKKSESISESEIIKKGDFLFNTRNTLELVGKGATWFRDSGNYVYNNNIAKFTFKTMDTYFFNYLYNTNNVIMQVRARAVGTTSVAAVYTKDLNSIRYMIPSIEEQKKIGLFFSSIDDSISLHQQELDALKQTKQGFLQRMFPKDGETVPEVRLPSFSDEWVPWKLSDITDLITKGTTPKNMSNEGLINFVKVENINPFSNQITSYSKISLEEHNGNLKRSQLKKNDILFSIAGTLGRTAIVKEKDLPANTNQALAILRMKNTNIDFITTYLKGKLVKDYIRKNPTIGAQPNLSLQQLKDLHVFLPSNQEQIKIGTFFRQIDEVIELKEQELKALKQTKQGFLQKMFV